MATRTVSTFNNPTSDGGFITALPTNVFVAVGATLRPIAVVGVPVTPHAPGGIHAAAVMTARQARVLANGRPVVGAGDPATCGGVALPIPTRVFLTLV